MAGGRVISAVLKFRDENFSSGLRRANREAGDFGRAVNGVQNQVENMANRVRSGFKVVGTAAVALGTGAVAGLAASVASSVVQMDDAFNKLKAQTASSGDELNEYKAIANDVFVNGFAENLDQAATGVGKLSNMFKDLEFTELADVTSGSFAIAKAFDQEATEVGRTVKSLMSNFDELSATDATDLITVGLQRTGDHAGDLLDTFNEYSVQFKALGYDAEGFTATLIAGAESGAFNFDKLADSAKESFLKLGEGPKDTREALVKMGLDADQVISGINAGGSEAQKSFMAVSAAIGTIEDPVERNKAAIASFGTPIEDLGLEFANFFGSVDQSLGDFKGSTEQVANDLNSGPIARIKKSWRDMVTQLASGSSEGAGSELLNGIAEMAEDAVPKVLGLADTAMGFANKIRDNWGPIKETIIGIGTAVVAFKVGMATMSVVSTATSFVVGYSKAVKAGTGIMFLFNNVVKANPLGLLVTGITLAVTAAVLLYRNWDTVTAKTKAVWESIGGLEGALRLVTGPIGIVIGAAKDLATNWDNTKSVWENVWGAIQRSAAESVNAVIGGINSMIDTINSLPGVNIPVIAKVEWGSVDQSNVSGAGFREIEGRYAVGSNRITHDQVAEIHKDEMIIPARQAAKVRAKGGNIDNIDSLIGGRGQAQSMPSTTTTATTNNKNAQFGDINIYANGVSKEEVVAYIVPQLKTALKMV